MLQGGCPSKRTRLCVLKCGTRKLILREVDRGSMVGHFGEDKTYLMAKEPVSYTHLTLPTNREV